MVSGGRGQVWHARKEALESITRLAKLLGIDKQAGSIEPGKDADLVILRRSATSFAQTTLVRGGPTRSKDRKLQQLLPASTQSVTSR